MNMKEVDIRLTNLNSKYNKYNKNKKKCKNINKDKAQMDLFSLHHQLKLYKI
jgi:hypothetical protein